MILRRNCTFLLKLTSEERREIAELAAKENARCLSEYIRRRALAVHDGQPPLSELQAGMKGHKRTVVQTTVCISREYKEQKTGMTQLVAEVRPMTELEQPEEIKPLAKEYVELRYVERFYVDRMVEVMKKHRLSNFTDVLDHLFTAYDAFEEMQEHEDPEIDISNYFESLSTDPVRFANFREELEAYKYKYPATFDQVKTRYAATAAKLGL